MSTHAPIQNTGLAAIRQRLGNTTTPKEMTWGVEFEMAVPFIIPFTEDPNPEDTRIADGRKDKLAFKEVIKGTSIESRFLLPDRIEKRSQPPSESATSAFTIKKEEGTDSAPPEDRRETFNKYEHWIETMDESVAGVDPDSRYAWRGWEFNTRVFRGSVHDKTSPAVPGRDTTPAGEIESFCRVVRNNLRVQINDSCGLHVHIGLGAGGMPMKTHLKMLTFLYLSGEAILLELCDPTRRENAFCAPLTSQTGLPWLECQWQTPTILTEHWRRPEEYMPVYMLDDTWPCLSRRLLAEWRINMTHLNNVPRGHTGRNSSVRLCTKHRTMEFRMKEGTLDPQHIVDWTRLTQAIFEFCHYSTPSEFRAMVFKMICGNKAFLSTLEVQEPGDLLGMSLLEEDVGQRSKAQILAESEGRPEISYTSAMGWHINNEDGDDNARIRPIEDIDFTRLTNNGRSWYISEEDLPVSPGLGYGWRDLLVDMELGSDIPRWEGRVEGYERRVSMMDPLRDIDPSDGLFEARMMMGGKKPGCQNQRTMVKNDDVDVDDVDKCNTMSSRRRRRRRNKVRRCTVEARNNSRDIARRHREMKRLRAAKKWERENGKGKGRKGKE